MPDSKFIFATCQRGAESALKGELQQRYPQLRASFSRPGFVTFKVTEPAPFLDNDDLNIKSIFARTFCWSLEKVTSTKENAAPLNAELIEKARETLSSADGQSFSGLHLWQRDAATMGYRGFEPGQTLESIEVAKLFHSELDSLIFKSPKSNDDEKKPRAARSGERVLDVVLVEPNEWWLGWHKIRAEDPWTRWHGGIFSCEMGEEIVSRAYVKMREALATFRLPMNKGESVVEIGSSPGGASQALLHAGLNVIGVDPAAMHESLLKNRRFTHWRMRGHEIKKNRLAGVKWLTADLNVDPEYTLNTVEEIVTNQHVRIAGLILTIKLPEWKLATDVEKHLEQVRSWGFRFVRARQMSHNRQEYCIAALRKKPIQ
jgi:23S rRNA (cytidine2498-2'-O)-methyltransferase